MDLVTRSKATPPKSSATDNVASDQESQAAARLPVLPTPWPRFFESLLTTPPLYKKIVSRRYDNRYEQEDSETSLEKVREHPGEVVGGARP